MELFDKEIMQLKEISEKNEHGNKIFDRYLETFLNKIYSKKVPQHKFLRKIFIFSSLI